MGVASINKYLHTIVNPDIPCPSLPQAVAPDPSPPAVRSPRARRPTRPRNTINSNVYRERWDRKWEISLFQDKGDFVDFVSRERPCTQDAEPSVYKALIILALVQLRLDRAE